MLPKEKKEGREQHSRVKTYLEVPEELEDEVEEVDVKEGDDLLNRNYVKLGKVAKHIGGDQ
jgi:ribosomal protein L13